MKTHHFFNVFATVLLLAGVVSCRTRTKDPSPSPIELQTDDEIVQIQNSNDQANTDNQLDAAMDDVALAISQISSAKVEEQFAANSCSTVRSITLSGAASGTGKALTLTYDGKVCDGKIRNGFVYIALVEGTKFSDPGATWTVSFSGYTLRKVLRNNRQDTAIIEINGLHTVKNVTGGLVRRINWQLNPSQYVIHEITSNNMSLTFANGTKRTWSVARRLIWDESRSLTITGFGSTTGYTDVVTWGTNRFGDVFTTRITTPLVYKLACLWFPSQGVRQHEVTSAKSSKKLTVTESILSGTDGCATGYTISFVGFNGKSRATTYNW